MNPIQRRMAEAGRSASMKLLAGGGYEVTYDPVDFKEVFPWQQDVADALDPDTGTPGARVEADGRRLRVILPDPQPKRPTMDDLDARLRALEERR